jgi:hypothetical protein
MWRLAAILGGILVLAGCGSNGADGETPGSTPAGPGPQRAAQALGAALAFAAHSDQDVAVVDGYATLPPPVQRGEQPIDLVGGKASPCAQPPTQAFTPAERAAIRAAFQGRMVRFVGDPGQALRSRGPGRLLLVAARPLLGARRGTVMVIGCVPQPQQFLVKVHWDGNAWQALANGAG